MNFGNRKILKSSLKKELKKEKNFFVFFNKKTDRIPVKGPA